MSEEKKREIILRRDIEQRIEQTFAVEAAARFLTLSAGTLSADEYRRILDSFTAVRARLKESIASLDGCSEARPDEYKTLYKIVDHQKETVKQVLQTLHDAKISGCGWGQYGPSFPFQLDRYKGLVKSRGVRTVDPIHGPYSTYEITLTEEGLALLAGDK